MAGINAGLARFWRSLVFVNWLTRGRPASEREVAAMRGWSGAVNVTFEGEGGGTWHCVFEPGATRLFAGAHPSPRGTVRVPIDVFFRLLARRSSYITETMTGSIVIEGEGLAGNVLYGIVARVHASIEKGGVGGWLARRWMRGVLAGSGTGIALP